MQQLAWTTKSAQPRKAIPPGELPHEAWRLLLNPHHYRPGFVAKLGLGAKQVTTTPTQAQQAISTLIATIHSTQCLPVPAIINYTHRLPNTRQSQPGEANAMGATRDIHLAVPRLATRFTIRHAAPGG